MSRILSSIVWGNVMDKNRSVPEKTFCFDIDDVAWDFIWTALSYLLNKHWLSWYDINDVLTYDFQTIFGRPLTSDEVKEAAFESWAYEIMIPDENLKEFIESIKERYAVVFITSRYPWTEDITSSWFEKHWIFFDVIFYQPFKSYLTKLIHADYLVDDSLENAIKISKNSKTTAIIRNQPWNWAHEENRLIEEWKLTREQIDTELAKIPRINNIWDLIGKI